MTHITTWVAYHPACTNFIVKLMMCVTMRPQTDLGQVQDKWFQIAHKATIHHILITILLMGALAAGRMMPHYHIAPIRIGHHSLADVFQCADMILSGILGQEPALASTVLDRVEVAQHETDSLFGDRVTTVHVGPQGHAQESDVAHIHTGFFQHMHILQVGQTAGEIMMCAHEVTVVVFVIAHHVDNLGKGIAASLEETVETLTHGIGAVGLVQFVRHADIAAEDQHIGTLCVHKVNVAKLKMQIGCYRYLHFWPV